MGCLGRAKCTDSTLNLCSRPARRKQMYHYIIEVLKELLKELTVLIYILCMLSQTRKILQLKTTSFHWVYYINRGGHQSGNSSRVFRFVKSALYLFVEVSWFYKHNSAHIVSQISDKFSGLLRFLSRVLLSLLNWRRVAHKADFSLSKQVT